MTQVNLMSYQRTDLPPNKSKWKQHSHKSRSKSQKSTEVNTKIKDHPIRKNLIQAKHIKEEIGVQSIVVLNTLKVSSVLLESSSVRPAVNMVILQACAMKRKFLLGQGTPRHTSCKEEWSTCKKIPHAASQMI